MDLKDILSDHNKVHTLKLKLCSVANFVTKKNKVLHKENPLLPVKSQSVFVIATMEPS